MSMPHLLIVDDDALVRRTFARTLAADFIVTCAWDVVSAIALIDAEACTGCMPFDAILLDLHLPGMDGSDLFEVLTLELPDLAARVVIITGDPPAHDDPLALRLGDRYVMKTVPMEVLRATLKTVAFPRMTTPAAPPAAA